jgi:peptide/nickel transport system permease protein
MSELLASPPALPRKRLNPYLVTGALIISAMIMLSLLGAIWTPRAPNAVDFLARSAGPSWAHPFGTDNYGRDTLSRVMAGGWRPLSLGFGTTALALIISLPLALAAAYFRGRFDAVLMRFVDAFISIPLLVFSLLLIVGLGVGHMQSMMAIGLGAVPRFLRVIRTSAIAIAAREFVLAARARGDSALYIQYGEILPSLWAPIIVEASIFVGFALMGGAALSYLGLGTQPPAADWGVMIRDAQRLISVTWWPLLAPGIATSLSIVGFNLFGEGLNDALHARFHGGQPS